MLRTALSCFAYGSRRENIVHGIPMFYLSIEQCIILRLTSPLSIYTPDIDDDRANASAQNRDPLKSAMDLLGGSGGKLLTRAYPAHFYFGGDYLRDCPPILRKG